MVEIRVVPSLGLKKLCKLLLVFLEPSCYYVNKLWRACWVMTCGCQPSLPQSTSQLPQPREWAQLTSAGPVQISGAAQLTCRLLRNNTWLLLKLLNLGVVCYKATTTWYNYQTNPLWASWESETKSWFEKRGPNVKKLVDIKISDVQQILKYLT